MSIPEAANRPSHLQGRVESPIHSSPGKRRFSGSQCHFRWEKLRGNSFTLLHSQGPTSQCVVPASTGDCGPNARRIYRKPLPVRAWRIITPAKARERMGMFLSNIQAAHRRCPMRTRLQNFVAAPSSEPGPPRSRWSQPLGDVRGQAVRKGLGRDPATPLCV